MALDGATLRSRATLEEPDVRLELAFTDTDCLERFQQRVAAVRPDTKPGAQEASGDHLETFLTL